MKGKNQKNKPKTQQLLVNSLKLEPKITNQRKQQQLCDKLKPRLEEYCQNKYEKIEDHNLIQIKQNKSTDIKKIENINQINQNSIKSDPKKKRKKHSKLKQKSLQKLKKKKNLQIVQQENSQSMMSPTIWKDDQIKQNIPKAVSQKPTNKKPHLRKQLSAQINQKSQKIQPIIIDAKKLVQKIDKLCQESEQIFKGLMEAMGEAYDPNNLIEQNLFYQCSFCGAKYKKACALGGHISRTHPLQKQSLEGEQNKKDSQQLIKQNSIYLPQQKQLNNNSQNSNVLRNNNGRQTKRSDINTSRKKLKKQNKNC